MGPHPYHFAEAADLAEAAGAARRAADLDAGLASALALLADPAALAAAAAHSTAFAAAHRGAAATMAARIVALLPPVAPGVTAAA
jgi:3-deoxy-D-manno-octulosonic-acid transferase